MQQERLFFRAAFSGLYLGAAFRKRRLSEENVRHSLFTSSIQVWSASKRVGEEVLEINSNSDSEQTDS